MREFSIGLLFVALAILCSCSSKNPDEPKVVEAKGDSTLDTDAPEAVLLETARDLYSNGLFSVARESFAALQASYPLGPYAEFAQIKVADCYFESREYDNAAAVYQSFLKEHPRSRSADYVTFKIGLSHHMNTKGAGRDVAPVQTGIQYFEDTIRRFPASPYAASAAYYLEEAQDLLAAHQKEILDFYKKRGMEDAYADRLAEFEKKYARDLSDDNYIIPLQPVRSDPGADNAQPARPQIVEMNRSQSPVLRASYQPPSANPVESYERMTGTVRLQSATCVKSESERARIAFVFDDSAESIEEIKALARHTPELTPVSGVITLPVPGLDADLRTYNCFGTGDVVVHPDQTIRIAAASDYSLMHLEYPNRLVLIAN